jgi:thiol-disulfide isomerase/thioredoxin
MTRPGRAALAAVVLLALAGCGSGRANDLVPGPGAARVDVDTPELRSQKEQAGVEPCPTTDGAPVQGGLPDVTLPCFGGGDDVALASLRGPLVVNLWASWCGPCRQEMPILQAFHEQYGDRVPVLGIDWQDPQVGSAMQLVSESGVTYPLLADPNAEVSTIDGMPVRGLPAVVLLAQDGTVAYRQLQEVESVEELVELTGDHLGVDL